MKNNMNKSIKKKILLTEEIHKDAYKKLTEMTQVINAPPPIASVDELVKIVREHNIEGIIVRGCTINSEVIKYSPDLKVIVKHGVGYNTIDLEYATKKCIPVFYTPVNSQAIAEHAVGLIYDIVKKISLCDYDIKEKHIWDRTKYNIIELESKCLGIIGMGRIGSKVIKLMSPLNMKVLIYDPYVSESEIPEGAILVKDLYSLLKEVDILSVHCPLTKQTFHLLGEKEFKSMKPGSYVVNTSRGQVIDEAALAKALKEGPLAGAALETFEVEPIDFEKNEIIKLDNVVTTPHIAGYAEESLKRMGFMSVNIILKVLYGDIDEDILQHCLNKSCVKK